VEVTEKEVRDKAEWIEFLRQAIYETGIVGIGYAGSLIGYNEDSFLLLDRYGERLWVPVADLEATIECYVSSAGGSLAS
jgi:hypothetical protein